MTLCTKCGFEQGNPSRHICHRAFRGNSIEEQQAEYRDQSIARGSPPPNFRVIQSMPNDRLNQTFHVDTFTVPWIYGSVNHAGQYFATMQATQFTSEKRCSFCLHNYHEDKKCAMTCGCPSSFEKFLQDDGLIKIRENAFRGME